MEKAKWGLIGLGVGIAAGVAAGMLLAPKSGKETRKDLVKQADNVKESAGKKISSAKSTVKKKIPTKK